MQRLGPPEDRRQINRIITDEVNARLGLKLTDAFCGLKAYRVAALRKFHPTDDGYAMPLELWVQAAKLGLRIREFPVPLVYLDEHRSFGGALDDAQTRLAHYRACMDRALDKVEKTGSASLVDTPATDTAPQGPAPATLCEKGCP